MSAWRRVAENRVPEASIVLDPAFVIANKGEKRGNRGTALRDYLAGIRVLDGKKRGTGLRI